MQTLRLPAVVVLVGAAASGKTTLRGRLVAAGLDPRLVVSLDDERSRMYDAALAHGRVPHPLQAYTLPALRRADVRRTALLRVGCGYVADATHLRRRERRVHVAQARAYALPARALLLARTPLDVLLARNAERPPYRRVPQDVLAAHAHRHSLVTLAMLRDEGFDDVRLVASRSTFALMSDGPAVAASHQDGRPG